MSDEAHLTIGDVAARTGVSTTTLRAWERRHDFPHPARLPGGHRRYREDQCEQVKEVARRRDRGVRLEIAIADVMMASSRSGPQAPSVFASLRSRHPHLEALRLRKSMMMSLSWAIEDEALATAARPVIFGNFQRTRHFEIAQSRWEELARVADVAVVFSAFPDLRTDVAPVRVPLAPDAPMRHEWSVVCDSAEFCAALSAWELPGQEDKPNADRVMEGMWTVDPWVVRDAALTCVRVAQDYGYDDGGRMERILEERPVSAASAPMVTLFNRIVGYADSVR
ncbi:DICT sensory domain-containing protein [uncultured Nocardioides sp.]|uniref:DICT sensory domain-containing protein n=1 Tax=uncultured Nocardioides sp. TaxID=198441 RepID=UPI00262F8640|nr:DICT sensory domain-containing protein [uncultured Nocardioides sp.]